MYIRNCSEIISLVQKRLVHVFKLIELRTKIEREREFVYSVHWLKHLYNFWPFFCTFFFRWKCLFGLDFHLVDIWFYFVRFCFYFSRCTLRCCQSNYIGFFSAADSIFIFVLLCVCAILQTTSHLNGFDFYVRMHINFQFCVVLLFVGKKLNSHSIQKSSINRHKIMQLWIDWFQVVENTFSVSIFLELFCYL